MSTEIEFEGFEDKKSVYKQGILVEHPSKKFFFPRLAVALFLASALIIFTINFYRTKQDFARFVWSVIFLGFIIYELTIRPYILPYLAALQVNIKQKKELFRKGEITAEGIRYIAPDLFEPTTPWSTIYRAKKTDDLVVLFVDSASPMAFPRSFFKREADWQQFNRWVNDYVKERS